MEKRVISGSVLSVVGYLLSPLSWWNDVYINIPLAYVGGWLISGFYQAAFVPAFVAFYWLTNIVGFVMLHKGICRIGGKRCDSGSYSRKDFGKDLVLTIGYTVLMIVLVKLEMIHMFGGQVGS